MGFRNCSHRGCPAARFAQKPDAEHTQPRRPIRIGFSRQNRPLFNANSGQAFFRAMNPIALHSIPPQPKMFLADEVVNYSFLALSGSRPTSFLKPTYAERPYLRSSPQLGQAADSSALQSMPLSVHSCPQLFGHILPTPWLPQRSRDCE